MVTPLRLSVCAFVVCLCVGAQHSEECLNSARHGDEPALRKAVALSPVDSVCLASLGAVLGARGKLQESSRLFEQALRIDPDDWATRRNLASNEFQSGRLREARQNLEIVRKQNPSDRTALLLLGMVAEELADYPGAVRYLSSVPELVARKPESVAALARAYYKAGSRDRASTLLLHAGSEAVTLGAQVAADAGDFATAEQLLASSPPSYQLALVRYRAGKYGESEATLRSLLAAGAQSSDVFNLLGWCSYKQGNLKDAVAAMDLAIDREPSNAANYVDLGMILLSYNRAPVALEAAKKAVQVAPASYNALMLKGLAEVRMNLLTDAAETYRRASALKPDAPEALVALAVVLTAAGRAPEAGQTFQSALQRFPNHAVLYQEYGKFLAGEGRQDGAAGFFEKAVALDPSLADPHFELGKLALENNRPENALPHLEAAAKLRPHSSKIHFALSRAYREVSRREDAARELEAFEKAREAEKNPSAAAASRGAMPGLPEVSPQ